MLSQNINQGKLINDLSKRLDDIKQVIQTQAWVTQGPIEYQIIQNSDLNIAKVEIDALLPFGWIIDHFAIEGEGKKIVYYFIMKREVP